MTQFPACAHLGYLFTDLPLRDRFAAAARCGFKFIEHPSPYELSADEVLHLCEANGLHMVQIGLPMGGPEEKGLAALVGREDEFRAGVGEAIAYALTLGTRHIHPMSGVPVSDVHEADSWAIYIRNVAYTCDEAAKADLNVIIEPIGAGTLAGYFMNHPHKAMEAITAVSRVNLFMAFDVFHAAQNGVDPAVFTRQAGVNFRHVQVADDPGRHEPGTGAIDFDAFFEALVAVDYSGVIGFEYKPEAGTAEGLVWVDLHERITPLVIGSIDRKTPA